MGTGRLVVVGRVVVMGIGVVVVVEEDIYVANGSWRVGILKFKSFTIIL
jgi:hypothetical protein